MQAMVAYRAYFLDEQYRIKYSEDFEESSDTAAIERARRLLESRQEFRGVELWEDRRPVRLYRRPATWAESQP